MRLQEGIAKATESAKYVNRSDLQDVRAVLERKLDGLRETLEIWHLTLVLPDERERVDTGKVHLLSSCPAVSNSTQRGISANRLTSSLYSRNFACCSSWHFEFS
jgi:hypothetical protein